MGCAPSKGNNLAILGSVKKGRMLPAPPQERPSNTHFEDKDACNPPASTNGKAKEKKAAPASQTEAQKTPQRKLPATELVNNTPANTSKSQYQVPDKVKSPDKKEKQVEKDDMQDKKLGRKPRKNAKSAKTLKKKDKDINRSSVDQKVDFPEPLVKAHQAAYAYLNPGILKYDMLLGLLEQATQTRESIQPMVAFMALRYEEIIQGFEEMVDEGERVLKEHGEHLAWSSQMENLSSSSLLKSNLVNSQPPPDLLQQLLQYTTQRMRNVSRTVGDLGDSALIEAVQYFSSLSDLLEEKLKVKRATEARLMQLLTRIEMASLRKPGPEDSALFSEDSGIGAENESLAGSEKRLRRQSCESTGTNRSTTSSMGCTFVGSMGLSRQKCQGRISPSFSLSSLNSLGSTGTIMPSDQRDSLLESVSLDDGEDDNDNVDTVNQDGEDAQLTSKPPFSSPFGLESCPSRLPRKRIENLQNVEMTLKMKNAISSKIQYVSKQSPGGNVKGAGSPKTTRHEWKEHEIKSPKRPETAALVRRAVGKKASREQRSRSAESLRSKGEDPTLLELERTQKTLSQRLQKMNKTKAGGNSKTSSNKQTQGNSPAQSPAKNRKVLPPVKDNLTQPLIQKPNLQKCHILKEPSKKTLEDDKVFDEKPIRVAIKATPPASPPPSPQTSSSFHKGMNSVKKLIDTFSQGQDENDGTKVPGPLKGVQRCGVPVLPGLGNVEAVLSAGLTSCRPDCTTTERNGDLDVNNLPPPALEVLMDNSYESVRGGSTAGGECTSRIGKSPILKRGAMSQRLRTTVQTVTVLPSKGAWSQLSKTSKSDQQDTLASTKAILPDALSGTHPSMDTGCVVQEESTNHSECSDTSLERTQRCSASTSNSFEESSDIKQDGLLLKSASTIPTSQVTHQPHNSTSASRGRMLPSTPSTPSSLQRRLQSSNSIKKQTTPPTSESPSLSRTLPPLPSAQRRLPTPPSVKQNPSSPSSPQSYPLKAPSPPASPKVQRLSRENSSENVSNSQVSSNARSVFCPVSRSLFEAQPYLGPKPPQAWTSNRVSFLSNWWACQSRNPAPVHGTLPCIRRSQSDRRPSLGLPLRPQSKSVAETFGSEPAIHSKGLEDKPTSPSDLWDSQSDLRAPSRSASHPDLCIVGQALYRD